jgi:hypothetical protein
MALPAQFSSNIFKEQTSCADPFENQKFTAIVPSALVAILTLNPKIVLAELTGRSMASHIALKRLIRTSKQSFIDIESAVKSPSGT